MGLQRVDLLYATVALKVSQATLESKVGAAAAASAIRPILGTDLILAKSIKKKDEDNWIHAGCQLIAEVCFAE